MKKIEKTGRNGKNELRAFVGKSTMRGGVVELKIQVPFLLAERIKCAVAYRGETVNSYVKDALRSILEADEDFAMQDAVNGYFKKAKLHEGHIFTRIGSLATLSRLDCG